VDIRSCFTIDKAVVDVFVAGVFAVNVVATTGNPLRPFLLIRRRRRGCHRSTTLVVAVNVVAPIRNPPRLLLLLRWRQRGCHHRTALVDVAAVAVVRVFSVLFVRNCLGVGIIVFSLFRFRFLLFRFQFCFYFRFRMNFCFFSLVSYVCS